MIFPIAFKKDAKSLPLAEPKTSHNNLRTGSNASIPYGLLEWANSERAFDADIFIINISSDKQGDIVWTSDLRWGRTPVSPILAI